VHREESAPRGRAPGGRENRAEVSARARFAALLLLTLQLGLVGWLTLRPLAVTWVEPANFQLLATIRQAWYEGPEATARTVGAGLLPLAPLGVLLPALGRHLGGSRFVSFVRTVFAGAMIALLIQLLVSAAPSRVADIDQVLLGTAGVALTHLLCFGRLRALLMHRPSQPSGRSTAGRISPDQ
jgi:glycopeptide antibiotics resistance protein